LNAWQLESICRRRKNGSRNAQGNQAFISFINEVIEKADMPLAAYGFLENAKPGIIESVQGCIQRGANHITVVPVLLLPGIHANEDIPRELKCVKETYPDVEIHYGEPIGVNEVVTDLIVNVLKAAGYLGTQSENVLLVGHGSRDPLAAVEFEKLADCLRRSTSAAVDTGYITTAPFYHEKIGNLLSAASKVYLVPYLLFAGGFAVKIGERAAEIAKEYPEKEVILCGHIGFDSKLHELLLERMTGASQLIE
jgi:sirohydrochlorin ferrochelatase